MVRFLQRDHRQPTGEEPAPPAWLPGRVEVRVAGESFHIAAIKRAMTRTRPGFPPIAVLVPDPHNPHDSHAVGVYVNEEHAGFLARETALRTQSSLVAFSSRYQGRLVSCPAEIRWLPEGIAQVVLWLDPAPIGLPPEAFVAAQSQPATLSELLGRLDQPQPRMEGLDQQARADLTAAEQNRAGIDADYGRGPRAWPAMEGTFRHLADRLDQARDPLLGAAWLGVGRSVRYQRGRHRDALAAYVEALFWDRGNSEAWFELVEMASYQPEVPILLEIFARVPFKTRPGLLGRLLNVSHGHDRHGRMNPEAGEHLRQRLLLVAENQGDLVTVATLTGMDGLAAEKAGDLDAAVRLWRRAIAVGGTDEKIAERLSIWLVKQHQFNEAARVLRQALTVRPHHDDIADRMERRLARCEREMAQAVADGPA